MADSEMNVAVYPIGVVQRMTGLTPRRIRYYEQEGLLSPVRSKGNRRLYTAADVDRLATVKRLLAEGLTLDGVRASLEQHSEEHRRASAAKRTEAHSSFALSRRAARGHPPPVSADDLLERTTGASGLLTSLFPVNNQGALTRRLHADTSWDVERP